MADTNLIHALKLHDLGWSVIPLCHPMHGHGYSKRHLELCGRPGKEPMIKWKANQNDRWSEIQIREWWEKHPLHNLGVVCGSVSGIVMVDIDTDKGLDAWREMLGSEDTEPWMFGTGRGGCHLVYRWSWETAPEGNPFPDLKGHLDFLGNGRQSVVPPSAHKSGVCYEWRHGGPGSGIVLPDAPACLLRRIIAAHTKNREPVGGEVPPPIKSDTLKRAVEWTKAFEPAIETEGGHNVAFKLACSLVHGFGLDKYTAVGIMREHWNDRCQPPWTVAELQHKAQQAIEKGSFPKITPKEKPPRIVEKAAGRVLKSADEMPWVEGETVERKDYRFFFKPYVPVGVPMFLVGHGGVGKSTFQAHLASMAKRTLFLPGEEDPATAILPRLELLGVDKKRWAHMEPHPNWTFPDCCDRFAALLRKGGFDLVIVDPIDDYLGQQLATDEGFRVRELLLKLKRMTEQANVAFVACRHPGKMQGNLMVGSRHWRNVPRVIVEMLKDEGPPEKHIIRANKYQIGAWPAARYYELPQEPDQPPRFVLGPPVEDAVADTASEQVDRVERMAIEDATLFLQQVLAGGEMESREIYKLAEQQRLSPATLRRASVRLNLHKRREGSRSESKVFWALPPAQPEQTGG